MFKIHIFNYSTLIYTVCAHNLSSKYIFSNFISRGKCKFREKYRCFYAVFSWFIHYLAYICVSGLLCWAFESGHTKYYNLKRATLNTYDIFAVSEALRGSIVLKQILSSISLEMGTFLWAVVCMWASVGCLILCFIQTMKHFAPWKQWCLFLVRTLSTPDFFLIHDFVKLLSFF